MFLHKRTKIEIIINQIAQNIIPLERAEKWFLSLATSEQKEVIDILHNCVHNSHPKEREYQYAVLESGLKPTFTPCTLILRHGTIYPKLEKICKLPSQEYPKIFRLFITLLTIADERRRSQCTTPCNHWWHGDLTCYHLI